MRTHKPFFNESCGRLGKFLEQRPAIPSGNGLENSTSDVEDRPIVNLQYVSPFREHSELGQATLVCPKFLKGTNDRQFAWAARKGLLEDQCVCQNGCGHSASLFAVILT